MNTKKTILLLCAILLVSTQLALMLSNLKLRSENLEYMNSSRESTVEMHALSSFMDILQNGQTDVRNVRTLCRDNNCSGPVMVCRFSEYDCTECVEYAIRKMKSELDSTGMRMLLLGNYSTMSGLKSLAARIDPEGSCMLANAGPLLLPIDNRGFPYCFVVDTAGLAFDVFVPDKMERDLSDIYFNVIRHKWNAR